MKILARSMDNGDIHWNDHQDLLIPEAQMVHQLYLAGIVREFYFTGDGDAVLILECATVEEAERQLSSLPLVSHGLISFIFDALTPYTGFQRLFGS
jgi:hypothetical protein